jgi:NADP-dependent 3-hydroxy acid dehydrogenase YdfG
VLGTILSLKHEMRVMQSQGHGHIVNLSSTFGSDALVAMSYRGVRHGPADVITQMEKVRRSIRRVTLESAPSKEAVPFRKPFGT